MGELFSLQFDLLLCDLTSSFFEGLMEGSSTARRGHSRDHRPDCKQIVLALVVTPDGFPVYHEVFPGNTNHAIAFPDIVKTVESHFGTARRVWVLDRGVPTEATLERMRREGVAFLAGTPRRQLKKLEKDLVERPWAQVHEGVEVKLLEQDSELYVLARSADRQRKE